MQDKADENRYYAREFIAEYERETGERLRLIEAKTDEYPDAVLATADGSRKLEVEFAQVVLKFIPIERSYFNKYRLRFYDVLRPHRPKFRQVEIGLQPSLVLVLGSRPIPWPDVDGPEGRRLVEEFGQLLLRHFDRLQATGGTLLKEFAVGNAPEFPILTEHFDAVIVNRIPDEDSRKPHPDDPVIVDPTVMFVTREVTSGVIPTLQTKSDKRYSGDILVLHALSRPGAGECGAIGFHAPEIAASVAGELASEYSALSQRFGEIWLLNAYREPSGRRLYRLK